jgi:hypothetical protein
MTKRQEMGHAIVEFEGRFKDGKLAIYKLPAGDGGGAYEIAGINDRYHPSKAKQLKDLIESGQADKAKSEAATYIVAYTDPILKFFPSLEDALAHPHIEFLLRDSAFNRGNKGAATVLQLALGLSPIDGIIGEKTKTAFKEALQNHNAFARAITQARETYERSSFPWKASRRDESSKFWKGLANRWDKAHATALRLIA